MKNLIVPQAAGISPQPTESVSCPGRSLWRARAGYLEAALVISLAAAALSSARAAETAEWVCVSNERDGTVTLIDGVRVTVDHLEAVNGTPLLDMKPILQPIPDR